MAFNPSGPYILVGDARGGVISFKLPNSLSEGPLTPDPKDENSKGQSIYTLEKAKMDKYLNTQDKFDYIIPEDSVIKQ